MHTQQSYEIKSSTNEPTGTVDGYRNVCYVCVMTGDNGMKSLHLPFRCIRNKRKS